MKLESWKEELDRKYTEIMDSGVVEDMDKANEAVLNTISKLDEIRRSRNAANKNQ